jgi:hypothetical protein
MLSAHRSEDHEGVEDCILLGAATFGGEVQSSGRGEALQLVVVTPDRR